MTGSNNEDGHTTFDELGEPIDSFIQPSSRACSRSLLNLNIGMRV